MPTPRSSTKRERVPLIFSPSMLCWSQGGMSEWQLSDCNGTVKYMQYRYIIYICRYIPTSLFVKQHGNYFKYKYCTLQKNATCIIILASLSSTCLWLSTTTDDLTKHVRARHWRKKIRLHSKETRESLLLKNPSPKTCGGFVLRRKKQCNYATTTCFFGCKSPKTWMV